MEGVLFIVIVFGGGMLFVLSKTEIGRALADRIRGDGRHAPDPALLDEVERLRLQVADLEERMDFAERMLAGQRANRELAEG